MANAGGAWDNAKKIVETELKAKATPLHAAVSVATPSADPFKTRLRGHDRSSVHDPLRLLPSSWPWR